MKVNTGIELTREEATLIDLAVKTSGLLELETGVKNQKIKVAKGIISFTFWLSGKQHSVPCLLTGSELVFHLTDSVATVVYR